MHTTALNLRAKRPQPPVIALCFALLAALALAGCGTPTKTVPASGSGVPGSAPGPTYGQSGGQSWSPQLQAAESQLKGSLSGTGASLARSTDDRLWITLPGDLAFQANRSALNPAATAVLDKVVLALRGVTTAEIRIVGHTDAKGSAAANDALSLDRAASARDWMVARGMSPTRIAVVGRGSREPVASNDDETGRAANRRVEILVGERGRTLTPPAK